MTFTSNRQPFQWFAIPPCWQSPRPPKVKSWVRHWHTTSLYSYIFRVLWDHRLYVVYISKEFCSWAMGRQWSGIFHYHWWTSSITPRLLFSPRRLSFVWIFPFPQNNYAINTCFLKNAVSTINLVFYIKWKIEMSMSQIVGPCRWTHSLLGKSLCEKNFKETPAGAITGYSISSGIRLSLYMYWFCKTHKSHF